MTTEEFLMKFHAKARQNSYPFYIYTESHPNEVLAYGSIANLLSKELQWLMFWCDRSQAKIFVKFLDRFNSWDEIRSHPDCEIYVFDTKRDFEVRWFISRKASRFFLKMSEIDITIEQTASESIEQWMDIRDGMMHAYLVNSRYLAEGF
ncbi:MAG: hypothetical protein UT24_C0011G0015 [Candidatus Woesebacteria bacterium GW2011_GWB1_39_12]|uniref:Uncharacterized protein n=1 Tax=Candidatus Woesebacteria bacterium GW2011_GWB1_39_12 TaxID=1618574 RepID=A0A0G0QFQ0_9BACT|nr:MAG: hypothetical protein UT24_C0011G0015 [Candidatus Woesebacteria bacterium GW2011_GWB1_39_12]